MVAEIWPESLSNLGDLDKRLLTDALAAMADYQIYPLVIC